MPSYRIVLPVKSGLPAHALFSLLHDVRNKTQSIIMNQVNVNGPGKRTHSLSQTCAPSAHSEVQVLCLLTSATPALEPVSKQLLARVEIPAKFVWEQFLLVRATLDRDSLLGIGLACQTLD